VDVSYPQLGVIVREIARGLVALGIEPGDRVSILSDTCPEWTYVDGGAICAGATVAPVYQTSSPEECLYVLGHAESRVVFCENQQQLDKIAGIRAELQSLEQVIAFDGAIEGSISLEELRELGAGVADGEPEARVAALEPDRLATLVYTSGTTGPPKGCMLTHANFTSAAQMYEEALGLDEDATFFMFLPLAHVMARIIEMMLLEVGGTLSYWQRDPDKLLDDIKQANPSHFASVPRVFEKIHTKATAGIAQQAAAKRRLVNWAFATGRRVRALEEAGERPGPLLRGQHALADKLVLSNVRALFGDRLVLAVTASAPVALEVLRFFDACGIRIREAWAMTETAAGGTLNTVTDYRFGTVGRALPGVELSIAEDGEVLIKGPNVTAGYYKDDQATAEAFSDGWFHTGDLGSLRDGYLSITGRKKDIIITSSGKNITPVNVENELKTVRWISEAMAYGDNRSYVVALLILDRDEAPALAAKLGVASDPRSMADDPAVRAEIQAAVDAVNQRFSRIEQIKRFRILDHDFTQAAGELTPTMKVKRPVVIRKYADAFNALYE
jgi:long-chain acyl-CoA synthetase